MPASAHRPLPSDDDPARGTQPPPSWAGEHATRVIHGEGETRRAAREQVQPGSQLAGARDDDVGMRLEREPTPQVAPLPELTATGAALTVGLIVTFAGIVDRLLSPGVGVVFGFVFILASVYAAIRMCWRDSWAALALPPLVFVSAAGLSALISSDAEGGLVSRLSVEIGTAVLDHPLYLLIGTVLAAACLAYRARVE